MKYLYLLPLLLLAATWSARAQPRPEPTTAQLWQALRQHPQLDRRRVDLLNELADVLRRTVEGTDFLAIPFSQIDSLTKLSHALAHRLRYPQGESYATFLNPSVDSVVRLRTATKQFHYHQWLKQLALPQLEREGNSYLISRGLIMLIASNKSPRENPYYLQYLMRAAQAAHSPRVLSHAYRVQGYYYRDKGDYYQALQGFSKQLSTAQAGGLPDETVDALNGLSDLYLNTADYQMSVTTALRALKYVEQVEPAPYRAIVKQAALRTLGYAYDHLGNYSQALAAFLQAGRLGPPNSWESMADKSYIGLIYEQQRNPLTLAYCRQLLPQALRQRDGSCRSIIFLTLGRYYLRTGPADSAIANGQRALRTMYDRDDEINAVQLLYRAYAQRHRYAQAYAYQSRYLGLHDTLNNEQLTRRITAQRFDQDLTRQRGQITQLTQRQQQQALAARRQRRWLLAALGGLALLGGGASLLWRLYRQKQRANALLATQKAQIEEQAARLGALDEAKNQFFANASHELRTPLTLILGPLDTLLADPTQVLPAAAREPVALAHRQAQRLQQLVNRILDLTKLQAGRLALHPTPTDLAALLRGVVGQFESLATQRGVALHGPAAPPAGRRVLLDADKVAEILTNLLINALNHTPAGGAVQVALALPEAGGPYAVTVRDTGPGIAEAEQARVFERFYQSPQSHAQGGTGLGLALSRELALLLGGTLTLSSKAGQGAAFTLRFPAEALPAAPTPAPEAAPAAEPAQQPAALPTPVLPAQEGAGPRPRILVVEDQPDLREYLRSLLAPSYAVLLAEDGQAALELLAREAPVDLITTDAMMPRLSGTELLARLRADPTQHQLPVLMLTARADEAHRLAALTVGVDDYLTKPFTTAELLARVRALLARHQVRRQFAALPPDQPAPGPETPADAPALAAPLLAGSASAGVALPARRRRAEPEPAAAAAQLGQWQAQVASQLANEQFGPAELAALLCLSERTLYRRLGELAGLTPAAWLRELRLTQARYLFEAGTHPSVAAVADAVGFASPKYFAALYVERFGRRPTDY